MMFKRRRIRRALRVIHNDGLVVLLVRVLQKVERTLHKHTKRRKIKPRFLAKHKDILAAQWFSNPYKPLKSKKVPPYTVNWVMSPPRSGGGHQNIFRFIKYLEDQGHTCRVYLYSGSDFATVKELRAGMKKSYPATTATMEWLKGSMKEADAVFATGWETAYAVFNDPGKARKFYFVQDFEPYFYPLGSEFVLAENTYKFNFFGITAGNWLAQKLSKEYGMHTEHYDFGADKQLYRYENNQPRKEIFFYARPVTHRRGFELGIMALELFHKKHPDYIINLAGWDVADYHIPFPYKNLKTMGTQQLSELYNRCAASLVISLTNMSLLPLELLACGSIPVLNDGLNNRQVSDNPYIHYSEASPDALAAELSDAVTRDDLPDYSKQAADSVAGSDWDKAGSKFIRIIERELNG
jgi:glycosyltransferase involved in cell wall biosynthesis